MAGGFSLWVKTIFNCLQNVVRNKEKAENLLKSCSIDFNLRPEQLKIESYISLLKALKS